MWCNGCVLPSCVIDHGFKTWSYSVMVSVLPSSVIDHGFKTWSCGVMVSVLPSCVIDHGFKTWSYVVRPGSRPGVWCNG